MDEYEVKELAKKAYESLYDFREDSLNILKDSEIKAIDRVLKILNKIKEK